MIQFDYIMFFKWGWNLQLYGIFPENGFKEKTVTWEKRPVSPNLSAPWLGDEVDWNFFTHWAVMNYPIWHFCVRRSKPPKSTCSCKCPKKIMRLCVLGLQGGDISLRLGPPLLYAWFLYSKINMGKKQRLNGGSGGRHVIKDDHKEGEVWKELCDKVRKKCIEKNRIEECQLLYIID